MNLDAISRRLEPFVRQARIGGEASVWLRTLTVGAVLVGGTVVVYMTGGTKYVWPHVMYFAVVLAGVSFGRRAGIATAVLAGLLMGPVMPLDVAAGLDQPVRGWLVRMGFYVAIGGLAGYTRYRFHRLLDRRRTFLSSVSHELRTPLSAVVGFADILDREWNNVSEVEKRELVSHIRQESAEVAHVVDDLLVAARIDGGRLHIECEEINVRTVADSIIESLPGEGSRRRVRVDGSGASWADPLRVRQIVRNLMTNALNYGGENVMVDIRPDGSSVTVSVQDDGPGVPDMILPRLFEPFANQGVSSTMPQSVGLGLAVSRELAARMGGRLAYCRQDGQTIFTLVLPAASQHLGDRELVRATAVR